MLLDLADDKSAWWHQAMNQVITWTNVDADLCRHMTSWCHNKQKLYYSRARVFGVWRHRQKTHDDVIKWKHFPRYWPFVRGLHRSSVNSTHKSQWRGAVMFSLICVCINGWVNNLEAGDLRRYLAYFDVSVTDHTFLLQSNGVKRLSEQCVCLIFVSYLIICALAVYIPVIWWHMLCRKCKSMGNSIHTQTHTYVFAC